MKVIDVRTGDELKAGDIVILPAVPGVTRENDRYRILSVHPGFFNAHALIQWSSGTIERVPLQVRWTHPAFFLQHIAFWPS